MSDSQIRVIERFFGMISQPAQTAALNAALRLGVVSLLEQGQKTATQVAEACRLDPEGTEALLQVLVETGMVELFDDHFALSQAGRLTPQGLWAIMFDQWTALESALKTNSDDSDEPEFEREQQRRKRYDQFRVIHSQIQWAATGVALKLTEALGVGAERRGLNILDIGCGSAVYSMAIGHQDPSSKVHLVDDQAGLARARATVNSLDIGGRVEMTESSELVFPGNNDSFDLVIVADRIHVWSPDVRQRILATALRTLKPGGELAVIDIFATQERGRMNCNLFELQMLTGTGHSMIRLPALREQIKTTGFVEIQYTDLPVAPYTHGLMLAARPASAADDSDQNRED